MVREGKSILISCKSDEEAEVHWSIELTEAVDSDGHSVPDSGVGLDDCGVQ